MPQNVYRQKIFDENVDYINRHNAEAQKGVHTYTLGLNEYADLSTDEWKMFLLGADVYKFGKPTLKALVHYGLIFD